MSSTSATTLSLDGPAAELLETLFDAAPTASLLLDREGRVVRANPVFARLHPHPASVIGRTLPEGLPGVGVELGARVRQVLSSGVPVSQPVREALSATGNWPASWQASFTPLRDPHGEVTGAIMLTSVAVEAGATRSGSDRFRQLDGALTTAGGGGDAGRVQRLYAIAMALAKAHTMAEIVGVVLNQVRQELGAYAGSLLLLEPDGVNLRMTNSVGYPGSITTNFAVIPLSLSAPVCEAVVEGRMVHVTQREMLANYPGVAQAHFPESHSHVCLPLLVEDRAIGGLSLTFDSLRSFSDVEVTFMNSVAEGCAQALERGSLLETEQRSRDEHDRVAAVLDAVLEHAQAGFALFDTRLRFLRLNPAFVDFLGGPSDAQGRKLLEVRPDLAQVARALAITRDSGQPLLRQPLNLDTQTTGAGEQWLVSYYPVRTHLGALVGLGCTVLRPND